MYSRFPAHNKNYYKLWKHPCINSKDLPNVANIEMTPNDSKNNGKRLSVLNEIIWLEVLPSISAVWISKEDAENIFVVMVWLWTYTRRKQRRKSSILWGQAHRHGVAE